MLETHFSTEPPTAGQNAWIPGADENPRGPSGVEAPTAERALPPDPIRIELASQSFPKSLRLLRQGEFRRVYEEGQRRSAPLGTIFFRPNGLSQTRLGITAPVRLGNAVLRNRVKRRLREVFRLNQSAIPGGWDIVLNPRPAVATVPFQKFAREFLSLFPGQPPPGQAAEARTP